MTVISYVNASLELWGCVISVIVALCLNLSKRRFNQCDHLYFWMLGCNVGALAFDVLALVFRGRPGPLCWWGVRISNFIAFSMNYALLESFAHYLTVFLSQRTVVSRRPLKLARLICLMSLALVVVTQFFPVIYWIDAQNIYHRAGMFWISHAMVLAVLILCGWMLCRYRAAIEPQEKVALWLYILGPLIAVSVQMFVYGLAISNLADTISLVVVFLFLQAEQGRHAAERENLLTQSRISIMLSQIQPHFLYNALSVIQNMCHGKAPEAEYATIQFAEFLRGNLDSLRAEKPIPFDQELHHTQNYLWLEKQRFEEDLCVEYDIQTTGFSIPALTLQPIVENAVRYGAMKRECGGIVRVTTRETEDAFLITVADNGPGFDISVPRDDGRSHVGISNVRERLKMMCGGGLNIESVPQKGTTAVISIPKEMGA